MPKKVSHANLYFLKSGPSGHCLRRLWSKLPVSGGVRAPSMLKGRDCNSESLDEEAQAAIEEGQLVSIEFISDLPTGEPMILFKSGEWEEPAAIVEGDLLDQYQQAIAYQAPLLFEREALFGPFFWRLTDSDELLDAAHLQLEFLDAVDAERRRYERLKRRYDNGITDQKPRRESISEEVKIFVWRRDQGRCVQCGSQDRLEYDHVIPFSSGGGNSERNIQLLCERCNRSKGAQI